MARIHRLDWTASQTIDYRIGTIETIAGVSTYVSKPVGEYAKDKAVIIVTGEREMVS